MLEKDTETGYGATSVTLSWLVAISFIVTFAVSVSWPLMDVGDPERAFRRALHMTLGVIAFTFILLRIVWWFQNPKPNPPAGMPANAFGLSRVTLFFLYVDILGLGISGFLNAWAMG